MKRSCAVGIVHLLEWNKRSALVPVRVGRASEARRKGDILHNVLMLQKSNEC
jgi:hypothetical protein